jgi:hypothetical protein
MIAEQRNKKVFQAFEDSHNQIIIEQMLNINSDKLENQGNQWKIR